MTRYDVVLLDADRTLLDFERSEREALRRVLKKWGLPQDDPVYGDYSKINDALWAAFARGKIDQDFLVVERFAALLRLALSGECPGFHKSRCPFNPFAKCNACSGVGRGGDYDVL